MSFRKGPRYILLVGVLALASTNLFAIARWNGDNLRNNNPPAQNFDIPAGVLNTVVRVAIGWPIRGGFGESFSSGIVIASQRDGPRERGGWLCVLTSAHSTLAPPDANERLVGRRVGFGNGNGNRPLPLGVERGMYFPFPQPPRGNRVDLAIMGVRVTDWESQVPRELTIAEIADVARTDRGRIDRDNPIILAGFGRDAIVDVENRRYQITQGNQRDVWGTLRSGTNRVDNVLEHTTDPSQRLRGVRFTYQAIQSDMQFNPERGAPTSADAYMLAMDSGGPTFQVQDRQWRLVGIHSESEETREQTITQGLRQWDVQVFAYREWIETTCNQIIPEPATLLSLAMGSAWFMFRRIRKSNTPSQ